MYPFIRGNSIMVLSRGDMRVKVLKNAMYNDEWMCCIHSGSFIITIVYKNAPQR